MRVCGAYRGLPSREPSLRLGVSIKHDGLHVHWRLETPHPLLSLTACIAQFQITWGQLLITDPSLLGE